ncbi:OTU domain-containing protein 3 [Auxenochlorella protothecoides]|uniref:OTU domain-containing protein 3 n=1 Tax=Auxenochlorella protothecoides TaxID=3075 RepID=A0A087SSR5_AUXPR|nr:OTU domain-containing protein 3 [Auxenochlorella protothecoides]KFM28769.1 OTU domain-containing protein 3 [Auxenochlorella protothecoides]RMZ53849.1 hypothetical protein APUTEX25_005595 [Auxenochlorella protothecoides]|eukprot:RMZ53849.1 hypothetical protein APUTEX25_005595 [Auxenochlorella protothecoides]
MTSACMIEASDLGAGKSRFHCDELEKALRDVGLRIQEVQADGNCFFRSLSVQLHGHEDEHAELRSQVVQHLRDNQEVYEPFIEDERAWVDYCERMSQDAEWAGHPELHAASKVLRRNIRVYQAEQPAWQLTTWGEGEASGPALRLSYHDGNHYNSVTDSDQVGSGAAEPEAAADNFEHDEAVGPCVAGSAGDLHGATSAKPAPVPRGRKAKKQAKARPLQGGRHARLSPGGAGREGTVRIALEVGDGDGRVKLRLMWTEDSGAVPIGKAARVGCPCGSGKKGKACCRGRVQPPRIVASRDFNENLHHALQTLEI